MTYTILHNYFDKAIWVIDPGLSPDLFDSLFNLVPGSVPFFLQLSVDSFRACYSALWPRRPPPGCITHMAGVTYLACNCGHIS